MALEKRLFESCPYRQGGVIQRGTVGPMIRTWAWTALAMSLVLFIPFAAVASVKDVTVIVESPTYTGTCPMTLSITWALDGDPGTIFSHQFVGDDFPHNRVWYGYVPPSGSFSETEDVTIDAEHAGSHSVQQVITFGSGPGTTDLTSRIESEKVAYSVTCVLPSPSPPQRR
jgi:hypothetical protein